MTRVTPLTRGQRSGEKRLEGTVREILDAIPQNRIEELTRGRINRIEFTELITSEMEEYRTRLEESLYLIRLYEIKDTDQEVREAINRNLRQLGSPVRLKKPKQITKSTAAVRITDSGLGYDLTPAGAIDWASVAYDPFNVSDPEALLRVQSRRQAGEIFSHLAATESDMILTQVELGFTQFQEFSTGRTVIGRTTAQTARGIFPILESTIPGLSPDAVIDWRTKHTNGLFERWGKAVNNFSDRTANQLAAKKITGKRAAELLDNRTKRYADKLRRSRARMIARTETSLAQNAARQASYNASIDQGLVNDSATKTWVSGGFDVCNLCSPLTGRRVPLREVFYWAGGFRGGSGQYPPAHPNCRCKTRMDPSIKYQPELLGLGTPADPYRYQFADGFVAGVNPIANAVQAYEIAAGSHIAAGSQPRTRRMPPGMPSSHRRISKELKSRKTATGKETKRTTEVLNPVTQAMDDAGLSIKPRDNGVTTEVLWEGEVGKDGTQAWFNPSREKKFGGKAPKRPTRMRSIDEADYERQYEEYLEALQKYRDDQIAWIQSSESKAGPHIGVKNRGSDASGIGAQQNSLSHEIGHRLDSTGFNLHAQGDQGLYFMNEAVREASRIAGPGVEIATMDVALLPEEYRAAIKFLQVAKRSNATADLKVHAGLDDAWYQYTQKPIEVWARAFNQWFAENHGTINMIDDMALQTGARGFNSFEESLRSYTGYQWKAEEFKDIGKLVEEILRVRGQLQ